MMGVLEDMMVSFTEITNALWVPGAHGIMTKENIPFGIFQIKSLPVKLH